MVEKIKLREYNDERGSLVENTLLEIMEGAKHFFVSKSKPEVVRGNHYHLRKVEWFYIIKGKCELVIEDTETKKREVLTVDCKDNFAIKMEPNQAHAFKNTGQEELILLALVNEVHNQSDPDTYPYKVI